MRLRSNRISKTFAWQRGLYTRAARLYKPTYYRVADFVRGFSNLFLGTSFTLPTQDRKVLDKFVSQNCKGKRVLNIGVGWYTMHLPELANAALWVTVDKSEDVAKYGSTSDLHLKLDVTDLPSLFATQAFTFDVILLNGVLGCWGLDTTAKANKAITALKTLLADDGLLLIGYNNTPDKISFQPLALSSLSDMLLTQELTESTDGHQMLVLKLANRRQAASYGIEPGVTRKHSQLC